MTMVKQKKNHILFIAGQLGLGGAEKQLYFLTKYLVEENWRVTVIDFYPEQNGYWRGPITDLGITIYSYYKQPRIKKISRLIRDILRLSPDILHGWHFHTNIYANIIGRICNVPIRIGSIRENPIYWPGFYFYQFMSLFGLDLIISNSLVSTSDAQKILKKLYFTKRIISIPNFVDSVIQENVYKKNTILNSEKPERIKIVGVGRLNKNKNWELIIHACKLLKDEGRELEFSIIGEGPEEKNLQKLIKDLNLEDNLFLLGSIPNISCQLTKYDIFCLCSHIEGMPNVIMEASTAGLPVVATRVGGIIELVDDGKTGFLINDNDLGQLVIKLRILVDDQTMRKEMGQAGSQKMAEEYSYEKFLFTYTSIYSKLLKEKINVESN